MRHWLRRLIPFSGARRPPPAMVVVAEPATNLDPCRVGTAKSDSKPALFWPLSVEPLSETPISRPEAAALRVLQAWLHPPKSPAALMARAPAVVPRLLAMLRQEQPPRANLTREVSRDPDLTAAVLRLAVSPYYRTRNPVTNMDMALGVIGETGLRAAIAQVVLKPIFEDPPSGLAGRAAGRIWDHAEQQAARCGALAGSRGLDRFDGYLAGLLHNTGWTAALRALDQARIDLPPPFSRTFAEALNTLRVRLFGHLAVAWQLSPALTALGEELRHGGFPDTREPLADLLPSGYWATTCELFPQADRRG